MSEPVGKTRIEWNRLVLDPDDQTFWSQKVAAPTDECPTGSAVEDDVWYFPRELMGSLANSVRVFDWNVKCGDQHRLTDEEFHPLLVLCKNFALAMLRKSRRKHQSLATVKSRLDKFLDLAVFMAMGPWKLGRKTLLDLTAADVDSFVGWTAKRWRPGSGTRKALGTTMREVQRLGIKGSLQDQFADGTLKALLNACETGEHVDQDGEPKDANAPSNFSARPYSNSYCLKLLDISDFYMSELVDDICSHLRELTRLQKEQDEILEKVGRMHCRDQRWARNRYKLFLATHPFKTRELPFIHHYEFPPKNSFDLITLAVMLQTANLQRIAMATAAREGELLWMERGCLSRFVADKGEFDLISSRRFKNSSQLGGFSIGWPVSASAARSVRTQEKLADAVESRHLWLKMAFNRVGGRERLAGATSTKLQRFAELHEMDIGPGGSAYIQRFRPTMALLLMKGPKGHLHLAQRALGHGDLETTIEYLRMNPHLQADLAVALHGERTEHTPYQDGPTIRRSEDDIDAVTLDAILSEQRRAGMTARILAPDIVAFIQSGEPVEQIDTEAGGSDALGYALRKLIQRDVLRFPDLVAWFTTEAVRLADAWPAAENLLPPRLKGFLGILRTDSAVHAPGLSAG